MNIKMHSIRFDADQKLISFIDTKVATPNSITPTCLVTATILAIVAFIALTVVIANRAVR